MTTRLDSALRARLWREPAAPPGRAFLVVAYVVMLLGGAVLGIFGALLLPYSVSSSVTSTTTSPTGGTVAAAGQHVVAATTGGGIGQILSVGLLIALVVNPLLSWAGLKTAGTRLAAFTPLAGWLIVVLPLAGSTKEGDLVLPSGLRSIAFLLLGAIAFAAVGALGRPSRGMSALLGQPLPRNAPALPVRPTGSAPRKAAKPKPSRAGSKGNKRR